MTAVCQFRLCESKKGRPTIDTTHLLGNHDCRGSIVRSPDPGHGKAVPEAGKVACASSQFEFLDVDYVTVIVIPSPDDWVGSQAAH